jgi:hypothetical protein
MISNEELARNFEALGQKKKLYLIRLAVFTAEDLMGVLKQLKGGEIWRNKRI